jgi:hypothetical protein
MERGDQAARAASPVPSVGNLDAGFGAPGGYLVDWQPIGDDHERAVLSHAVLRSAEMPLDGKTIENWLNGRRGG